MAAITFSDILARQRAVRIANQDAICIVVNPGATSDATAGVYRVKDPNRGTAVSASNAQGNPLDGWKSYSHADLGTAYGL